MRTRQLKPNEEVFEAIKESFNRKDLNNFQKFCQKQFKIPFPRALTSKGWKLYREYIKVAHPIYYFLTEKLGWWLTTNIGWPVKRVYEAIKYGIRHRTYDKYHIIDTGLKPDYYELETRMLHGMFNLLKDFVEIQKAHMQKWCGPKRDLTYETPRDLGLAYLDWEISLTYEKECEECGIDPNPKYTGLTSQALTAKEIKELYLWWVDKRPKRKDPWDHEGLKALPEITLDMIGADDDVNHDDRMKCYKEIEEMEEAHHKEDEDMLIRLIKIRRGLWT